MKSKRLDNFLDNILIAILVICIVMVIVLFGLLVSLAVHKSNEHCDTTFSYVDFNSDQGESNYCYSGPDGMFCELDTATYFQVRTYQESPLVCRNTK